MIRILLLVFMVLIYSFSFAQSREIYINKTWTFEGNRAFYIPLHLPDSLNSNFEFLKNKADSVIVSETFLTRKKLPDDITSQYFDLQNIQKIRIYNSEHELVSVATFKRVEYYEDMIDGMFIAVFEPEKDQILHLKETSLYCLSENAVSFVEKIKSEEIVKKQWTEKIRRKIYFNQDNLLTIKHFEVKMDAKDKLTLLSLQNPETKKMSTYLLEQNGPELVILQQFEKDFVIWDLLPIPVSVNNKPVLLVEIVRPETDFTGYVLAVFNGNNYRFYHDMRLKI